MYHHGQQRKHHLNSRRSGSASHANESGAGQRVLLYLRTLRRRAYILINMLYIGSRAQFKHEGGVERRFHGLGCEG